MLCCFLRGSSSSPSTEKSFVYGECRLSNQTTEHRTDVIIVGAGPAGYTAAIYAARANRKPILVTGIQPGGQLVTTTDVENYPGFADIIQGPWLVEQMQAQAEHMGTRIVYDQIVSIET